ncbi:MAG: hypothetical protein RIF46_10500, partial [Cyclobacteriaceae bacterium]
MKILLSFLLALLVSSAFAQYEDGSYTDLEGNVISGLIKIQPGSAVGGEPMTILYKEGKRTKQESFGPQDISSLNIGGRKFVVREDLMLGEGVFFESDFVEVLIEGRLNLYVHKALMVDRFGGNIRSSYILEKDGKKKVVSDSTFKTIVPLFIADDEELIGKIERKVY